MKTFTVAILLFVAPGFQAQSAWTQKANFGGWPARAQAFGVAIADKGYLGLGVWQGLKADWWEYDPAQDAWTQKANFPGGGTVRGSGFAIGIKCYYIGGIDSTANDTNWVWEYDSGLNAWTQKGDFPGGERQEAAGVAIGNLGYVGLGLGGDQFPYTYYTDWWEYDPVTDQWTQKSGFPGWPRTWPTSLAIGNKGYVGMGGYTQAYSDFWEYDPSTDSWTQKANYDGGPMSYAVGFGCGNKGYVGTGHLGVVKNNYFFEYDPATDVWTELEHVPGCGRTQAAGWSINGKAYMGTGYDSTGNFRLDWWCYDPSSVGVEERAGEISVNVYPNPTVGLLNIDQHGNEELLIRLTDLNGKVLRMERTTQRLFSFDMSEYESGAYLLMITSGKKQTATRIVMKH
jgi:N-acetylneuraminic acid mutarotase